MVARSSKQKPVGFEREGDVPNVVYSCGTLLQGDRISLPYAMSDKFTSVASVDLAVPLAALTAE